MNDALTLGRALFGDATDGPHRVVRQLAALAGATQWLRGLAIGQLASAELELAGRLGTVFDFDLGDVVGRAWSKCASVVAGLNASRRHPEDTVIVPLTTHQVTWSDRPVIEVYQGSARLARFELEARAELSIRGAELELLAGRAGRVLAGQWSATASLSCAGAVLASRETAPCRLPVVIQLLDCPAPALEPSAPCLVVDPAPSAGPATVRIASGLVIGRHPSCGVVFWDDPAVANHHAAVHRIGEAVILEDLCSPAGTLLNGRRMNAPAILRAGDTIGIGRRRLVVSCP